MSYRYFLASSRIEQDLALLDRLPEIGILDRRGDDQIHRPLEKPFEGFVHSEIGVGVSAARQRRKFDQEIQIAFRRVPVAGRRAEQVEPPDMEMAA